MEATALTATEARVAGLVAAGHANREIGAQLALRPKAVEIHLACVYRKLGVRSRTELALLLGAGARPPAEAPRSAARRPAVPDERGV